MHDLTLLATVENIFKIDGVLGPEIVFLYSGLDPLPSSSGTTLTECDGRVVPVMWRALTDDEVLPLYPAAAAPWVGALRQA